MRMRKGSARAQQKSRYLRRPDLTSQKIRASSKRPDKSSLSGVPLTCQVDSEKAEGLQGSPQSCHCKDSASNSVAGIMSSNQSGGAISAENPKASI